MPTTRTRTRTALLLAALLVAACGAASPVPPVPTGLSNAATPAPGSSASGLLADVCGLLTPAEIGTATRSKAQAGEATVTLDRIPGCRWALDSGVLDFVAVSLVAPGGQQKFDYYANDYYEVDPTPIEGVGDAAVKTGTEPGGTIYARRGDQLLMLSFSLPMSVDDPYAVVQPLAAAAISRLP